jgi:hypothetical protein
MRFNRRTTVSTVAVAVGTAVIITMIAYVLHGRSTTEQAWNSLLSVKTGPVGTFDFVRTGVDAGSRREEVANMLGDKGYVRKGAWRTTDGGILELYEWSDNRLRNEPDVIAASQLFILYDHLGALEVEERLFKRGHSFGKPFVAHLRGHQVTRGQLRWQISRPLSTTSSH